jgi:hypothetical protein
VVEVVVDVVVEVVVESSVDASLYVGVDIIADIVVGIGTKVGVDVGVAIVIRYLNEFQDMVQVLFPVTVKSFFSWCTYATDIIVNGSFSTVRGFIPERSFSVYHAINTRDNPSVWNIHQAFTNRSHVTLNCDSPAPW